MALTSTASLAVSGSHPVRGAQLPSSVDCVECRTKAGLTGEPNQGGTVKPIMNLLAISLRRTFLILCVVGCFSAQVSAAPIPKLFGTGVDDSGALLEPEAVDPHYTIIASPDEVATGPEAFTLLAGFPVGPWFAEGPNSRWIAPQADQSGGNAPGIYTYRTTFDLTGLDPTTAQITGSVGTDDGLTEVRLNGTPLSGITSAGFGNPTPFTIPAGSPFMEGINVLEFDINNGGEVANPTGLRLDMSGRATGPGETPVVLVQPLSQSVVVGDSATFVADAAGTPPLAYQWFHDDQEISGQTGTSLSLSNISTNDAGGYQVRVTNASGATNSGIATLSVLVPFPGIYNTGVDDQRALLTDGEIDPHYKISVNADIPESHDAFAQITIPSPPWLTNGPRSRWIGPALDASASGGEYTYQLILNLTGYDPSTAFLEGSWATDDGGSLFLNGADTGFRSPSFTAYSTFSLTNGFVTGTNVLEFRIMNGGANPTGLRVENLRGTAQPGSGGATAPRVVTQPRATTRVLTEEVTFTVVADGSQPLSYQWLHDSAPVQGGTNTTLVLSSVTAADAGVYQVRVSNDLGSTNSEPAALTVVVPQIGVFNTGTDSTGVVLATGQPDPHYVILNSPDSTYTGPTTFVTAGPIPPWVLNDENSAWIAPRADAADAAPGSYRYRLIFSIDSAAEVATAELTANVGTDDGNAGVFLNGVQVDFSTGTGFGALTELVIPAGSPFREGLNTLDFVVVNGGAAANPTGLRVDDVVFNGVTQRPALRVAREGGEARVSWPVSATGFVLQETNALPGGWADSTATISVSGDENVASIPASGAAKYFRLSKTE